MRTRLPLFVISVVCAASCVVDGEVCLAQGRDLAAELIDKLESAETTPEQRRAAEDELAKISPMSVVPLLVPIVARGMPSALIYNGAGTPEGDAKAPPEWRAFYSYHRVWERVAGRDPKLTGSVLTEQLKKSATTSEKTLLIHALERYWVDDAEAPVAAALQTPAWYAAASCLIAHRRDRYFGEIKSILEKLPSEPWQEALTKSRLVQLIIDKRARANQLAKRGVHLDAPPVDPEVVVIAFELLKDMHRHDRQMGYFLALSLGDYVGQEFKADQRDPKYQTPSGLDESFFIHTVDNALKWWEDEKETYTKNDREKGVTQD